MAGFILCVMVILLAMGGLGIGVALGRAPLRGSCGGLSCAGACSACPKRRAP